MGGSGGGYFHISNPNDFTKKLREEEEKLQIVILKLKFQV